VLIRERKEISLTWQESEECEEAVDEKGLVEALLECDGERWQDEGEERVAEALQHALTEDDVPA
jgi:hypothetical protein